MRKRWMWVLVAIVMAASCFTAQAWICARFVDNGDGTVTDKLTKLMWVGDLEKAGINSKAGWANRRDTCASLVYAGYEDWRMPKVQELGSIVDYEKCNPAIDEQYFVCEDTDYWTRSLSAERGGEAWSIYFGNGFLNNEPLENAAYARPVRNVD